MDGAPLLDLDHIPVSPPTLAEGEAFALDGYVLLEGVLGQAHVLELAARLDALCLAEGAAAGSEFAHLIAPKDAAEATHIGNLASKDVVFARCLTAPRVLAFARRVIGPHVRVHAVNARIPKPGGGEQELHPHPGLLNTLWLLDDMNPGNGPTQIIAGSHRSATDTNARTITAPAGSVIVLHPLVLHGGTNAVAASPRRVVTVAYSDPSLPPQAKPHL